MIQSYLMIFTTLIMLSMFNFIICNPMKKTIDSDDYNQDIEFNEKTEPSTGDIKGRSADCSGGGMRMGRGGGGQSQPIVIVTGGSGGSTVPMTPPADGGGGDDAGGSEGRRRRRARRRRARLVRMARKAARNSRTSG